MEEIFEEVYSKVNDLSKDVLKDAKKTQLKILLITAIILVVASVIIYFKVKSKNIIPLIITISVGILLFVYFMGNKFFRQKYKDIVIKNLIKIYNSKMYYDPKYGINMRDYKLADFNNDFNEYYSEDRIFGTLDDGSNFQMAEVVTAVVETQGSGKNTTTTRNETFSGLYGIIELTKNLLVDVLVVNNSHLNRYSKDRIEIDSSEFEEFYDLITKDKIMALRIFTPEIIEKFNELRREHPKYGFELKLVNDKIFYRFRCGHDLFEPPIFKSSLDKKSLEKYFKLIYYTIELSNALAKSISNIED